MKTLKLFFLILSFQFFTGSLFASEVSLDDLDKVLQKASSINEFLDKKDLQEEYFSLAKKYYGANFTSEGRENSFWVILDQMKTAVKNNPKLGERLWSTKDLGTNFQVDVTLPDKGVLIKGDAYKDAWAAYISKETRKYPEQELEKINSHVLETENWIDSKRLRIDEQVQASGLNKPQRESLRGKLNVQMQKDILEFEPFQQLHSYYMKGLGKKGSELREVLSVADTSETLNYLEKLRSKEQGPFLIKGLEVASEKIQPFVIRNIPKELLQPSLPPRVVDATTGRPAETTFFTVRTREVKVRDAQGNVTHTKLIPDATVKTMDFKAIPRRFHAAFKGVELGECVAGGHCSYIAIERWAVPALSGSNHYYIETAGNYRGWTSLYPGVVDSKSVVNIEFGSTILAHTQRFQGESYPYFEFAMKKMEPLLPKGTVGFLIGDSDSINNAGILSHARSSRAHQLGRSTGIQFVHQDQALLDSIIGEQRKLGEVYNSYGGKGVIDVNLSTRGNVLLSGKFLLNKSIDDQTLVEIIESAKSGNNHAVSILLSGKNTDKPEVIEALIDIKRVSPSASFASFDLRQYIDKPAVYAYFLEQAKANDDTALRALAGKGFLERREVLDLFLETGRKNQNSFVFEALKAKIKEPEIYKFMLAEASKGKKAAINGLLSSEFSERPAVIQMLMQQAKSGTSIAMSTLSIHPLDNKNKIKADQNIYEGLRKNPRAIVDISNVNVGDKFYSYILSQIKERDNEVTNWVISMDYKTEEFLPSILELNKSNPHIRMSLTRAFQEKMEIKNIIIKLAGQGNPGAMLVVADASKLNLNTMKIIFKDIPNVPAELGVKRRGIISELGIWQKLDDEKLRHLLITYGKDNPSDRLTQLFLNEYNLSYPEVQTYLLERLKKGDRKTLKLLTVKKDLMDDPEVFEQIKIIARGGDIESLSILEKSLDNPKALNFLIDMVSKKERGAYAVAQILARPENIDRPGVLDALLKDLMRPDAARNEPVLVELLKDKYMKDPKVKTIFSKLKYLSGSFGTRSGQANAEIQNNLKKLGFQYDRDHYGKNYWVKQTFVRSIKQCLGLDTTIRDLIN